jgi:putative ABC transport system ATP-binding protein
MARGPIAVEVLRSRGTIAAATALFAAHQICEAAVPVLVGVVVDEAIEPGDATALVLLLAALALLFAVLSNAFRLGARVGIRGERAVAHALRMRLLARVLDPRGGAEAGRLSGDLATVAGGDAGRVGGLATLLPHSVAALLAVVAGGLFLLDRSLVLGLIVLGGLPPLLLAVELLSRPLARRANREREAIADAGAVAADLVAGLRPLKGIGGEAAGEARYRAASATVRDASIRAARAGAAYEGVLLACTGTLLVAVALVGGREAAAGDLSLGGLIAALGLTQFLIGPLSRLGWAGGELARSRAAARRVADVLGAPFAIEGGELTGSTITAGALREDAAAPGARHRGDAAAPARSATLALRDVRDGELERVGLAVAAGELVAVAPLDPAHGEQLVRLLGREADPQAGAIELDGVPLTALDPVALRARLLVAGHEATLFEGTLREQVLGAVGSAEALAGALLASAADEVVASVPGGLDAPVTAGGRSLSGGQRQRVALARALCAQPPLLVLHEPTTAVDAATEARIAAGLRDARRGRTTLVVTTSPALLAAADRVVVLDRSVLAEGRHDELVGAEARYRAAVLA